MADATLVLTFNAATGVFDLFSPRRRSDRPEAAVRDDGATTAHYMGIGAQTIPVPEVIEPPKAKPALAGLSVTAPERFKGLGFSDI